MIGTAAYLAPEQIEGRAGVASDQYALAVVVYEWLSGTRPFHGSLKELCTQHLRASPPSLREKLLQLSPGVEQVIMRALAKDPRQRFGSIRAFASALEQASRPAGPVVLAPSPAVPHRGPTPASRPLTAPACA